MPGLDVNDWAKEMDDAALRDWIDGIAPDAGQDSPTPRDDGSLSYDEFRARCDAEDGTPPPAGDQAPLAALDWGALADRDVPPRRWLVEGLIPQRTVTALYGDGGIGKSLLAQQLLTATATGTPWLGLPVASGPALGLFCEDDLDELWRRQEAICRDVGLGLADLARLTLLPRVGEDNLLMTFARDGRGTTTPFYRQLTNFAVSRGARTVLIDTAADTFGGNENDRGQVRQFIQVLVRLAQAIAGQVILLAHPSRAGLASGSGDGGSTAWHNSVRSRLYLTRPTDEDRDGDRRVLRAMKANYGPTGDEIALRWRRGVFVRDGGDGGLVAALDRRAKERAAEAAFLACLRKLRAAGRYASDTEAARDRYAPKLIRTLPEGRTHSLKALREAMERLFAAGQIRVESVRASNRHPIAAIVEVD